MSLYLMLHYVGDCVYTHLFKINIKYILTAIQMHIVVAFGCSLQKYNKFNFCLHIFYQLIFFLCSSLENRLKYFQTACLFYDIFFLLSLDRNSATLVERIKNERCF